MIYSMTGYASKVLQYNNTTIQLEIKSVNHRFLDITIKAAEEFKSIETTLRSLISQRITRGKLDIKIFFKENTQKTQHLVLNNQLLLEYIKLTEEIQTIATGKVTCSINDIINFPGMLTQNDSNLEQLHPEVLKAFEELLYDFCSTQLVEGSKLQQLIWSRLEEINKISGDIQPILKKATEGYQLKLKQRLQDFLKETEINDNRLQQEFAFFCQKMDVSEEIDRLEAHVSEFMQLLKKGGNIGKRLDFICQEMHREANTFGSKSIAIETTRKAVDLKVLIEQIREQVQNIM